MRRTEYVVCVGKMRKGYYEHRIRGEYMTLERMNTKDRKYQNVEFMICIVYVILKGTVKQKYKNGSTQNGSICNIRNTRNNLTKELGTSEREGRRKKNFIIYSVHLILLRCQGGLTNRIGSTHGEIESNTEL